MKLRKRTSIVHFLLGAFCAVLWTARPGLSVLIWTTFVVYELWSERQGNCPGGYLDVWEGLIGLVAGAVAIFTGGLLL